MGRITSGIGLVSGINSKDIIDQLMALESRPKSQLQARIDGVNQKKLAYTDLSTRLASLKLSGQSLKKISFFQGATTSSTNEDVLTATATSGAAIGAFSFQVARLVTTQQSVSRGYADFDSDKVGAGTLTIEMGGGELTQSNLLSELNGGAGVRRGQFKITDRGGATAVIDTTAAISLDDVVKKINTSLDIAVRASISGDKLVLSDLTGKTVNDLKVEDIGDGHAAADLGIAGNSAGTVTLTGIDINFLGRLTSLSQLNDGRGVRTAATGNDFNIALSDGSNVVISLASAKTIGDAMDAINAAAPTKVKAELVAGGNEIKLSDTSGGGGSFAVTALNSSNAAQDLGILATGSGGVINGKPLLAALDTVLITSLNGGQGFTLGTISIQSRAAGSPASINLSAAISVQDVIDTINNASAGVKASLNASGNGLQITDTSGGTGNLVIADVSGTTATDFGLAGTFNTDVQAVRGANLQRQWASENTLLTNFNGGKGVSRGKFKITNSAGISATVDLSQGNESRLKDVIAEINSRGISVTASINAKGDGLLLTDTAAGSGKLKVEEAGGTTASELGILGEAAATTIDGSMEKTVEVTATDTLATLEKKINDLNFGVTASIINDGSATAPFRLSLTSKNSGRAGRVVFDAGATNLDTRTLVEAQDAAVFLGAAGSEQPLLITASKNQLGGVVKGVNIELHGVSDKPVTLGVTRDVENVVAEVKKFTDGFNELTGKIKELTKFDVDANSRGLLLGEASAQTVQSELFSILTTVNPAAGRYRILADVGIRLGDGAKLEFDEDKFRQAYATDPDSVQRLFTSIDTGIGAIIEKRVTRLVDPVTGVLTRENKTLDLRTSEFQNRIKSLDKLLESKRARLERQFSQLESVLANLQSQQTAIGQIQTIRPPAAPGR
jgi:flagellar hook-associated protein 2